MVREIVPEEIKKLLKKHGQSHLLKFWDELSQAEKEMLLVQIQQLDFSKIDKWVNDYVEKPKPAELPRDFLPAPFYPAEPADTRLRDKYKRAEELGRQLISDGYVCCFVVAGGQGTRLGFDGPKGNFSISPIKNKTLFRLFAETILAAGKKYGVDIAWYIMTSPLNYEQTKEIFRSNNYYGMKERDVFIFEQGQVVNFGFDGRILLAGKGTIVCSPDGHGGSIQALYKSGAIDDMRRRGVEIISYWQVDNPLVKILDPLFIGLHRIDGSEMSSKALIKAYPTEKVGNFCLVDGKVTVIEYSDLPDQLAEMRKEDGRLVFELGSIAIHIINRSFIERLNETGLSLPFHRAVKKIPYIDDSGRLVNPSEPNSIKLESFIFDALPMAEKSIILETLRDDEFAPVKNATGADSPEVTNKMMVERWAGWLEQAGVSVPRKKDGSIDCLIEISPSFAIERSDIKDKARRVGPIKKGDTMYLE